MHVGRSGVPRRILLFRSGRILRVSEPLNFEVAELVDEDEFGALHLMPMKRDPFDMVDPK